MTREFTDPFTGDTLDNPTPKTYEVTYRIAEFGREKTTVDTLAEGRLTKQQAKQKLLGRPTFAMTGAGELEILNVKRLD